MSRQSFAIKALIALISISVCGCASLNRGKSDEELIRGTVDGWKEALKGDDVDTLLTFYSDDYEGWQGGGKEQLRQRMSDWMDRGFMKNVDIATEALVLEIEGNMAVAGPITISSERGDWSFKFEMKKERGTWLIAGRERAEGQ